MTEEVTPENKIRNTRWRDHGIALAQEHRLRQFAIADWLLEGIELVGATSTYNIAERLFPQYARRTFVDWVSVAKHFPKSIRIDSDFLTFKHYQVVQGCENIAETSENQNAKDFQLAAELVWLRKADELQMSVSVLREAVHTCWVTKNSVKASTEDAVKQLAIAHKEWEKAEPKKENFQPKWVNKHQHDHAMPSWLKDKRIDQFATARGVAPHELIVQIFNDFAEAHQDELRDAEAAQAKRDVDQLAADAAQQAVEEEKHRLRTEYLTAHNKKVLADDQRLADQRMLEKECADVEYRPATPVINDPPRYVIDYVQYSQEEIDAHFGESTSIRDTKTGTAGTYPTRNVEAECKRLNEQEERLLRSRAERAAASVTPTELQEVTA